MKEVKTSVLLLAAGRGSRFKAAIPKQFVKLMGKPLIAWSLIPIESLIKENKIDLSELVIVCEACYQEKILKIAKKFTPSLVDMIQFAEGGAIRQESVYHGLQFCKGEQLLLHETARPCLIAPLFDRILASKNENVTLAEEIPFTVLKRNTETGLLSELLRRDELFNVQLPQKFNTQALLKAHELAKAEGKTFTDDSSLLFNYGGIIATVKGSASNLKVTHPQDLAIAKAIIKRNLL